MTESDIWKDDRLGRRHDAEFLIRFLLNRIDERKRDGRSKSYVLNLNARWGQGKTYFLTRLGQHLSKQGYLVATVNAWVDDHADDPLIAVMSAINATVCSHFSRKQKVLRAAKAMRKNLGELLLLTFKHGSARIAAKIVGDGAGDIADAIQHSGDTSHDEETSDTLSAKEAEKAVEKITTAFADKIIQNFERQQNAIKLFRKNLGLLLHTIETEKTGHNPPLFVLVDELDRCRPPYAISLLERVKHLFEVENVVFIIATDSAQLQHSIKAVYGTGFDAGAYLLRFFDRTYVFEDPTLDDFVGELFARYALDENTLSSPPDCSHRNLFITVVKAFDLDLRSTEQCFEILRNIVTAWNQPIEIELLFLLPLIVAFLKGDNALFQNLADPSGPPLSGLRTDVAVVFKDIDTQRHVVTRSRYDLAGVVSALRSNLSRSLPDINSHNSSHGNGRDRWIADRFRREFQILHLNMHNPAAPPFSILKKYPEYVRSAGRLLIERGKV